MRSDVKQRRSDPGRRIRDENRPGNRRLQRMQREYQQNYLADPYAGTPIAEIWDFSQHYGENPSRFAENSAPFAAQSGDAPRFADSGSLSASLRAEPARFEAPPISLPPQERRKKTQRRMRTELLQQDTIVLQCDDKQRDSALQTEHREVLHSEGREVLQPEGLELSHDKARESRYILEPEQRSSRLQFEDSPHESNRPQESSKGTQKKRMQKQSAQFVRETTGQSGKGDAPGAPKAGANGQNPHVLATAGSARNTVPGTSADAAAGKAAASRSRLRFTPEELSAPLKAGADAAAAAAGRTLQHKLAEGQDENAAVEAAGRTIEAGQAAAHSLHGLKLSGTGSDVSSQHSSRLRFSRSTPASKAEGKTMDEILMKLAVDYGWSRSVPNFSEKLTRGSLRYREAVELADALGYDLVWRKRA